MASRYITYPIVQDARDLMQRAFDYLKTKIPGWQPSEGQLDVWLIEAFGSEASEIAGLASEVPKTVFRYFGSTVMGIPPISATPAVVQSTWFFTDAAGHTIRAGTQVGIRDADDNLIPFYVLVDVIVAGGQTQTAADAVTLVAAIPGANTSGLGSVGGDVELIDPIAWVDHITQSAVTSGGADAESDDDYLSRLSQQLQLMGPRPILPRDFAILARNIAGIQRAAVLDGYNPADQTFNNERMVTVVPVDVAGQPVSAGTKTTLAAYLESLREVNFVVNTLNPTLQEIDVSVTVKVLSGYDPTEVASRVEAAVIAYLNPANWGVSQDDDPNDPQTWVNEQTIYYLELATVINNVAGVDRITALTLGAHGGAQVATDYVLNGVVPLPFTNANDVVVGTA